LIAAAPLARFSVPPAPAAVASRTVHAMSYSSLSQSQSSKQQPIIEPRRLELSVNPEDGSLLTAPLSTVLLAATDGLYTDLYNAAHGELDVTIAAQTGEGDDDNNNNNNNNNGEATGDPASAAAAAAAAAVTQTKKERMSNLSFAQRRHELAWRLIQHSRGLTHVAALCAAHASTDFATATRVSTRALQHARTAWVQADEAQDALYFFHAQLFPARQSPHDVYGALDTQLCGRWFDMPTDLQLITDRFQTSREARWSPQEVSERWQMAVRNKLLTGEVAWMRRQQLQQQQQQQQQQMQQPSPGIMMMNAVNTNKFNWNIALKGGIVRLTHGIPKPSSTPGQPLLYPMECLLTVLSTSTSTSEWSLLSVEVRVTPKTGESNHQLEASNRQRYNLHRLSALAMAKEEARVRKLKAEQESEENENGTIISNGNAKSAVINMNGNGQPFSSVAIETNGDGNSALIPRPLEKLFEVVHTFALSWQLELLSAQAQALKRGNWAAGGKQPIVVTPVTFTEPIIDEYNNNNNNNNNKTVHNKQKGKTGNDIKSTMTTTTVNTKKNTVIGVVSMSFWRVDDQYGPPFMGDLQHNDENDDAVRPQSPQGVQPQQYSDASSVATADALSNEITPPVANQLTLSIRAETNVGIRVSLSGGMPSSEEPHIQATLSELIDAASNPFALSASGALLAATRLCSEQKCHAIVRALQPQSNNGALLLLPTWMYLKVERTCIAVFARINYHGIPQDDEAPMVELLRLACDARTGNFLCTFARSAHLLRHLACNDERTSVSTTLRVMSLPPKRRRVAGANSIAKIVRDALDGLTRSMNALGYRTGVGGVWKDRDGMSASLRQRAIQSACGDARVALVKACGIVAMYGLSALALGVATGVTVTHDM